MTIGPVSQCSVCAHFKSPLDEKDMDTAAPFCDAFPTAIPEEILANQADHRKPFPGDHGIRWKSDGRPFPEESFQK